MTAHRRPARRTALAVLAVLAAMTLAPALGQAADGVTTGSASGLPVPRFVSLKSDRVNLREGPSKDHRTTWVFQRAGLPVEVTAEFETWRRIRDSDGAEGWVLHSLLSGRRTALVAPWEKTGTLPLSAKPDGRADVVAQLQPGVLASIKACNGKWCRLAGQGFDGWLPQDRLWGAYPAEKLD
ncbi:MAG: SH3 domain-containing protein [Alsobacter sp.]